MPEAFYINDSQLKKLDEWMRNKPKKYTGAIGGRFTFLFHPTTLGVVVKVKDETDQTEVDLSDYENW